MPRIEIFELATGKITETLEVSDMGPFETYWRSQCNSVEFSYVTDEQPTQRVVKISHKNSETRVLTNRLLEQISRWNGELSKEQVWEALQARKPVYTGYSRWELASTTTESKNEKKGSFLLSLGSKIFALGCALILFALMRQGMSPEEAQEVFYENVAKAAKTIASKLSRKEA